LDGVSAADAERVAALYRAYGGVVYWRCRTILGDDTAAEDATQETFLRVQRYLARAPDGEQALRWIWRIATNHCLSELRNRRRRPEPREKLPEPAAPGAPLDQVLADRDLLRRVTARVGEKLQAVAWLHYFDGIDADAAAELLGVTRRTVTNRLERFHQKARKIIARLS